MTTHSPRPLTLYSKTTSCNLGTHFGGRYRVQAWESPQCPPGPQSTVPSMKTECYPAGAHMSCSTAASLTTSLEFGSVMFARNATTLSGPHSSQICNNGMVWSGSSHLYHKLATIWTLPSQ
eukprot:CCRYP_019633-RB/>CCRYP_019633-RB protein AED:0.37 eAED:1.00 QI:0/-1/0/1/-1/0/1/0/120